MPINNNTQPWPPSAPFPESQHDSLGTTVNVDYPHTSDFPQPAGERERGKFRPARIPRLTTVAVVNDDGSPINDMQLFYELLVENRAMRIGIERLLSLFSEDVDVDLLSAAFDTDSNESSGI